MNGQTVLAFSRRNRLPIILFAVALLLRFLYLLGYSGSPFFQTPIADALYHEEWAKRILAGDVFSLKPYGVFYKAPLYPYFIAVAYLISGNSNFFLAFLQIVLTALSCLLLFLIGKRYFGVPAAFIGALAYCFYFPSVFFSTEVEIPAVAIFLTLLSFYFLIAHQRKLSLAVCALIFGLSLLALPSNLLLLPLYILVLLKEQGGAKHGLRKAALFIAIAVTTVLPCTVRNLAAGHHLTLISANGGMNFYIGNNDRYDETVSLQPGYAFERFYDEPRRIAGASSFSDRDRYWYEQAFGFILAHPGQEALLLGKKLALYFADYEIYRNTDSTYAKAHSIYKHIPFVPASLILASGLVGLFLAVRQRHGAILIAFCVLQALPCLIFFVTDRYRLPSMAVWSIFSGFFFISIADAITARNWRTGAGAFAGTLVIAIFSNLNLFVVKNPEYRPHFNLGFIYETQAKYDRALQEYATALHLVGRAKASDRKTESEIHARLGNVHMLANDFQAARESFERAATVDPDSAPAYSYLGSLYDKQGEHDRAIEMFNRALAIDPADVVSLHNLALVYLKSGRLDEAFAKLSQVIALAPEHSGAHTNLAYIYGAQGKYDLMENEAKQAIEYDPAGASARYNLASLYLNTGRVDEAVAQYEAITRTAPRDASNAYNQLGVIHAQRNELQQATGDWQSALQIDPNNQDARANLERARAMLR